MSKLRSVDTCIWGDTWFEDLKPSAKLLFLYFITNEKTNMLGVYEISIKKVSFETSIPKDEVLQILELFKTDGKIKYLNNRVVLVNYIKHQKYNLNMKKSAIDIYNDLPLELKTKDLVELSRDEKGFDTLCKTFGMVSKVEVEYEYEDEEEEEEEDIVTSAKAESQINFDKLLLFINNTTGRNFKVINKSVQGKYLARLKEGYTNKDIQTAIVNSVKAKNHIETKNKYLTPEFFSRPDKIDMYSSLVESKSNKKPIGII